MQPKKGSSGKKDKDGKADKINIEQVLLDKDLEIETLLDKVSRLENRSQTLVTLTEQQQVVTKEMVEKLQDIISFLTRYSGPYHHCYKTEPWTMQCLFIFVFLCIFHVFLL
jgi:hypothetical protein